MTLYGKHTDKDISRRQSTHLTARHTYLYPLSLIAVGAGLAFEELMEVRMAGNGESNGMHVGTCYVMDIGSCSLRSSTLAQ